MPTPEQNSESTHPSHALRVRGGFAGDIERAKRKSSLLFFRAEEPANARRGFTLVELVTVIAIIAILSSIVMVSLGSAREKARDGRRIAEIKNLQLALDFYFEVNGRYPTPSEFGDSGTEPLVGKYISTMPTDPKTGGNYRYSSSGAAPFDYHLGASLETDHEELENDTDFDSSAAVPPWTSVFNGVTGNCFGPTGTPPPDMCYDVKAQ